MALSLFVVKIKLGIGVSRHPNASRWNSLESAEGDEDGRSLLAIASLRQASHCALQFLHAGVLDLLMRVFANRFDSLPIAVEGG